MGGEPREGPLYRPPLGLDLEATLVGVFADDLQVAAEGLGGPGGATGLGHRARGDCRPSWRRPVCAAAAAWSSGTVTGSAGRRRTGGGVGVGRAAGRVPSWRRERFIPGSLLSVLTQANRRLIEHSRPI